MTKAERAVESWNNRNPVGTPVVYYPFAAEDGSLIKEGGRRVYTRSDAFIASSNVPVIHVKGIAGYVALSHCMVPSSVTLDSPEWDSKFAHLWPPAEEKKEEQG